MLLTGCWGATSILVLYGGVQVAAQILVRLGLVQVPGPIDAEGATWHLLLWDPWFLLWGLLLGAATLAVDRDQAVHQSAKCEAASKVQSTGSGA